MGGGGTPRYLPPGIGQQMEYLIRCGRYASCVHAGGLSCSELFWEHFLIAIWPVILFEYYPCEEESEKKNVRNLQYFVCIAHCFDDYYLKSN